jgi:PGF-CTERM protein
MTEWKTSRRETLQALGVAAVGAVGVGTARGQEAGEATITVDPSDVTLDIGATTEMDVVVLGAENGVDAYEFELVVNPAVATFVDFEENRGEGTTNSSIENDGAVMRFVTALLDSAYEGADEITVGSVTLSGEGAGETAVDVTNIGGLRSTNGNQYNVTDDDGSATVNSNETLSADFDFTPAEPAPGEAVSFDASESTGNIVEYRWDFNGDGVVDATSTDPEATNTYDDAGERTVTLEVENQNGDTEQASQTVTVGEPSPELDASFAFAPSEPTTAETVIFDASDSTGDIVEYRWDFDGDGTVEASAADSEAEHTYDESGEQTVTLEIEDGDGNTDQTSRTVTVTEPPELDAAFGVTPGEPTAGEEATFDASASAGAIVEYRWTLGDGTEQTTSDSTVAHTYDGAGEYTVTLELEGEDGTTDQTSQTVTVSEQSPQLDAAFGFAPSEPNAGESVVFDAEESTGAIVEYRWTFGDGSDQTTTGPNVIHTYDEASEYTVTLEVENESGDTAETSQGLTVTEAPTNLEASFGVAPAEPAVGEEVTLDASDSTGDIVEYRWTFGDGTETTTQDPVVTHTYDEAGQVSITLELEGVDGQTSSTTVEQSIDEGEPAAPTAALDGQPLSPEAGEPVTLDASGSTGDIVEYRWDLSGDGTVDETTTGPTLTHIYDSAGTRSVEVTVVDTADQTASATVEVSVSEPVPPLEAAVQATPTDADTGEEIVFDAGDSTGEIVEYRWDLSGDGNVDETTTGPTLTHIYDSAGTRSVEVTVVDTADGTASATVEVSVSEPLPPLEATFQATPTDPVTGETVTFDAGDATGDIVEYEWSFGDGTDAVTEDATTTHSYDESGTVTVELTVTDSADQQDTATQTLDVAADSGDGTGTDTDDGTDDETDNGTDGSEDGSGPGFGPASALAGLGGAAYLLKQRLLGEDSAVETSADE